ncbi:MAG: HupE/UreJ family protein [Gammaproteobacteria bacterium]|nr:HupE/UreJ family protein [Gammaproteobacteria bacterium]
MKALAAGIALAAAGLLIASAASAHRLSPAYFGLTETPVATSGATEAATDVATQWAAQWKVSISGGLADALSPQLPEPCTIDGAVRRYVYDDAQVLHAAVVCSAPLAGQVFAVDGLPTTDTDVLLRIDYADGGSFTHRLVPEAPSVVIPERPGTLDVIATYTVLGVEHILIGIDHLLFVLALLLLVKGWVRLAWTITAFTLAHSITLAAAVLGFVNVASAAVEATIALSILFLATELAKPPPAPHEPATLTRRFPWLVAFSFGLLHGFGFAGVLTEIGLPEQAIPLALLFFNIGVELGQLAFVAAVLAAGFALRGLKLTLPAWSPRLAAYVIGSVAAFWVFERTLTAV